MLADILILVLGLALLVLGGNWVTDGSASVARRLHMSGLLVGLTIVALGSCTPDLVVGVFSTVSHKSQLAVGDVVGAAIFDFLLVIGLMALVRPLQILKGTVSQDLPLSVLVCWLLFFMADDMLIDGAKANILDRSDGLVMLSALALFMIYTINDGRRKSALTPQSSAPVSVSGSGSASGSGSVSASAVKEMPVWRAVVYIVAGLAALVFGGQWFVDGASGIARQSGMSEGLVGLTIVAIGGSLPDLATSLIATLKNQPGIAIGNIIGGCIYNVLLVLGTCSVISPLSCGTISQFDFLTMLGAAMLVWIFSITGHHGQRMIGRAEGAILVLCYAAYMTTLILFRP